MGPRLECREDNLTGAHVKNIWCNTYNNANDGKNVWDGNSLINGTIRVIQNFGKKMKENRTMMPVTTIHFHCRRRYSWVPVHLICKNLSFKFSSLYSSVIFWPTFSITRIVLDDQWVSISHFFAVIGIVVRFSPDVLDTCSRQVFSQRTNLFKAKMKWSSSENFGTPAYFRCIFVCPDFFTRDPNSLSFNSSTITYSHHEPRSPYFLNVALGSMGV